MCNSLRETWQIITEWTTFTEIIAKLTWIHEIWIILNYQIHKNSVLFLEFDAHMVLCRVML